MAVPPCPYCPITCETSAILARHIQHVHGHLMKDLVNCPFCTVFSNTASYLKKHIHDHHPPSPPPEDMIRISLHDVNRIPDNDEEDPSADHTIEDTGCHKVAALSPNTIYSNKRQKYPATFQCTLCPKRYTRAFALRAHIRYHFEERPFVCTVCGKCFPRNHDRKTHEKLHSGEKDYVCKGDLDDGKRWGCGRRFARLSNLARHFRSAGGKVCIASFPDERSAVDAVRGNLKIKSAISITDRDHLQPDRVDLRDSSPEPLPTIPRASVSPSNPPERHRNGHRYRDIPKLDRTMTDIYSDELYNPNFTIDTTPVLSYASPVNRTINMSDGRPDVAELYHLGKKLSTETQHSLLLVQQRDQRQ